MQGIDQHSAGSEDVFASGAADVGSDAVVGEVVAEPLHLFFVGTRETLSAESGGRVETDEVDTAGEVAEEVQEFVGMADGVVLPMPADVFKTDTSLVRPVVLF